MSGKFGIVTAVLLIPIAIGGITGMDSAISDVRASHQRIIGLKYLQALTALQHEVSLNRLQLADGRGAPIYNANALDIIAEVHATYSDELDVQERWENLRLLYATLEDPFAGPVSVSRRYHTVAEAISSFQERVTNLSGFTVDASENSALAATIYARDLPSLMEATVQLHEESFLTQASSTERLRLLEAVTRDHLTTQSDLQSMRSTSQREDLKSAADTFAQSSALVRAMNQDLGTLMRNPENSKTVWLAPQLVTSVNELQSLLGGALDSALLDRESALNRQLMIWMFAVLMPLLGAVYLTVALIRSTTSDVRRVLTAIRAVTEDSAYQPIALSGQDEFADMSKAVLQTSDRLTSLMGELRYAATHDDLTGLSNRAHFTIRTNEALKKDPEHTAVVMLDLDGFQNINDSFGHDVGDRLLRLVGSRLQGATRTSDIVGRFSADEFAVLLRDVQDFTDAEHLTMALQSTLAEPIELDGRPLRMQASCGIAMGEAEQSAVDLVRNADVALYLAKNNGQNQIMAFEAAMHSLALERTELSVDLANAIPRNELFVVYQPIIDVGTGRLEGMEALVRWMHPTRGLIPPDHFIGLAETSGLILDLGAFVLGEATGQMARWHKQFPELEHITIDVNLSAMQLNTPELVEDVMTVLRNTGIDPSALILEITESAVIGDAKGALERLQRLALTGVRIALDDFGTGYSSLSQLKNMPIHILKIDKSFIRGLNTDPKSEALARCIIDLATSLGMRTVAEGIEAHDEAATLRRLGCHMAQGYHFGRPMSKEDMYERLAEESILLQEDARNAEQLAANLTST